MPILPSLPSLIALCENFFELFLEIMLLLASIFFERHDSGNHVLVLRPELLNRVKQRQIVPLEPLFINITVRRLEPSQIDLPLNRQLPQLLILEQKAPHLRDKLLILPHRCLVLTRCSVVHLLIFAMLLDHFFEFSALVIVLLLQIEKSVFVLLALVDRVLENWDDIRVGGGDGLDFLFVLVVLGQDHFDQVSLGGVEF